jgi:hypothetical protein
MPRCCNKVDIKCRLTNVVGVKRRVYYYFFKFTNTLQSLETNIANNNRYFYFQKHIFHISPTWKLDFLLISRYYFSLIESLENVTFFRRASYFAKIVVNFTDSKVYFLVKCFPEDHFKCGVHLKLEDVLNST